MQIEIITPDKKLFSGNASSVQFPGTDGSFGVQNNHAAMISTLKKGQIKLTTEQNTEEIFEVNGGVVEILSNKIIVLAE
jgi:F-type H+-transporting ATPase subunit epsilon